MTDDPERLRSFFRDEVASAWLYRRLAGLETDPDRATVWRELAETEERHADHWETRLRDAGRRVPARRPGARARILAFAARRLGPEAVLPTLAAGERAAATGYGSGPMAGEERAHARALRGLAGGAAIARGEGRHRTGGNALRAAVLGANDGLVSNLSLVMGVAGADFSGGTILVTGLAGLLAGAGSMAMGEWLSVQSSRELYQRQIRIEGEEIRTNPREETEELALLYRAKGLPEDQARAVAERLMADPETALDTMAREELGIDPGELGGSAWVAAATSFALFAVGAIVPVVPFLLASGGAAIGASLAASAVALFAIGAAITIFTGRGVVFSGLRQLAIGVGAAALTFGLGRLIGVGLG